MEECKNCRKNYDISSVYQCKNCGATVCMDCARTTKMICPYCYSDLDFFD